MYIEHYTNLESLNGNFDVSSNVFVVLITGDTGDKVRGFLLFGDIGIGRELTVGNELVSSVILQNISIKLIENVIKM